MSESRQPTVMVVDDDPQIRHMFSEILVRENHVVPVESGEAALQEIDEAVDVVLLDRRMLGLSGGEVLHRLREAGFDVPVAMITAVEPDFDILEMGFDDYIVKPIRTDDLRDLVSTLVVRKAYDDVMREYFSLVSKVSALQQRKTAGELEAHEAYLNHRERLDEIEEAARAALDAAIETGTYDELFRDLAPASSRSEPAPGVRPAYGFSSND